MQYDFTTENTDSVLRGISVLPQGNRAEKWPIFYEDTSFEKSPDCSKQPGLVCAVKAGEVLCPLFLFQIDQIAILVDLNLARFHRFGNLANQVDM